MQDFKFSIIICNSGQHLGFVFPVHPSLDKDYRRISRGLYKTSEFWAPQVMGPSSHAYIM